MRHEQHIYLVRSAEETQAFAEYLGLHLQSGDLVCLSGDLGTGKTTFAQGLSRGLGLPDDEPIRSPTFTLLAEYHRGRVPFFHFDVYRLSNASGLAELAFDEVLEAGGVVLIEWADKVLDALPEEYLYIAIDYVSDPTMRKITLMPHGSRAESLAVEIESHCRHILCPTF